MDRTDPALFTITLANSTTPYQKLSDVPGLSVSAVCKRIGAAVDGVIKAFTARVGIPALREEGVESTSVDVLSTGHAFATSRDKLLFEDS